MDAFAAETLPHLPELRRAARRYARAAVAEDLVQETYLRAWRARDRYRPGSNARAWLYTILQNAAHTARRRELREARMRDRLASAPPQVAEPPAARERTDKLADALGALPEPYRRVVELTDLDGLSYREAAVRLAVPVGTVMSRLHRARRRLRARLNSSGSNISESK